MNKRQVKGTAKDVAGKLQRETGRVTGSQKQKAAGLRKQVEGKTERAIGDVEEMADRAQRSRRRRAE